jgi:hypothetical protein
MSISTEVTFETLKRELPAAADYVAAAGLALDDASLTLQNLRLYLRLINAQGETFHVEFDWADYPLYPPTVEFVSADHGERGTKRLYPQGFHSTPCICMRYNRKAYGERGGPHGDWRLLDWRLPSGNGIAIDTLCLMISDLHSKVRQSNGRMT